ncbi:MAG: multidrug transporter [Anaerolineales bacterium]|nr:MAG: multidrug transporter [Anaerolineales bacterium]
MKKIIIRDKTKIPPFNEPARGLRVLNKPLWLYQRDVLAKYCTMEIEVDSFDEITVDDEEVLVYRNNLFFDEPFIDAFITAARASGRARQVAFALDDKAIVTHALPLQDGIRKEGDVYVADLWYFPHGIREKPEPLVIDTEPQEKGFYHIPTYMAEDIRHGDVVYYVPLKAFLSIENWVHVLMANSPFGVFAIGARMEKEADKFSFQLKAFVRALLEHKQVLSSSAVVRVGKNVQIDPTAIIKGPSFIGDNVFIGAGAMIDVCIIGNNVTVMQGSQLSLSVVSDGCYIPFRAALFMSALMENSMVAQNACLQLCLVGRDSFVGAGVTFTDFNVIPKPLRTMHKGELQPIGRNVWGGCVGHHCRIGADLTIYPCRTIESDTVLIRSDKRAVIDKNVSYEESDHHHLRDEHLHHRLYPRGQ